MIQENPRRGNGTGFADHVNDAASLTKDSRNKQVSPDDITIFMPGIDDAEYQLRAKIRTMKNCATAMIARTDSETARALAWACSSYATAFQYAGASDETLREIGQFCHRLMVTAMQAEKIDGDIT